MARMHEARNRLVLSIEEAVSRGARIMKGILENTNVNGGGDVGFFWHTGEVMRRINSRPVSSFFRSMAAAGVCLCGLAEAGAAQQAPADSGIPTLHAYADLVQVPTLVLGTDFRPLPKVDERSFRISFDGGPRFAVTHARIEGDDPLSVAILLDPTVVDSKNADEAIASLVPLSLHPEDTVSIYAMDCELLGAPQGLTDAAGLKRSVDLVLRSSEEHGDRENKRKCQNPVQLFDALADLVQAQSTAPGRRIILVVTDGVDRGSRNSWDPLRHFAQTKGVTIFGLVKPPEFMDEKRLARAEQPFNAVSESSGGLVLYFASGGYLKEQFVKAIKLTRGRYILEFPRPLSSADGMHNIEVTIARTEAFIRPAGASFPTLKPSSAENPNTIGLDPTGRPQVGKVKPIADRETSSPTHPH